MNLYQSVMALINNPRKPLAVLPSDLNISGEHDLVWNTVRVRFTTALRLLKYTDYRIHVSHTPEANGTYLVYAVKVCKCCGK
jgi:hypothetical protein